jgi:hypothetical protein
MKARMKNNFRKSIYLLFIFKNLLTRQTQFYMAHHIHSFQQIKLITVLIDFWKDNIIALNASAL